VPNPPLAHHSVSCLAASLVVLYHCLFFFLHLSLPYFATLNLGYPQIFLFLSGTCGARILD
jgi:hypothetical protein